MDINLDQLREIVATSYTSALEVEYGGAGMDALRRLTPALDEIHSQLAYELVDKGLTVACPLDPTERLLDHEGSAVLTIDQLAGRVHGTATIELLNDERLRVSSDPVDPLSLAARAVVYHFDGSDHFAIGDTLFDVANPTNFPSLWGVPTFFDLKLALEHYRDALALHCGCPHLQTMWVDSGNRWILTNKPEDTMQLSLHRYLVATLRAHRSVEVRREQPAGGRKPPDIKITWSGTNRLAFVEVKWMGASAHATEQRITWRPGEQEANKGAGQLAGYLDANVAEAPGYQTMGFLVVFDARRDGVDFGVQLTLEQALHFLNRDVAYDPDYSETRHDFAEPIRFYIYPAAPTA